VTDPQRSDEQADRQQGPGDGVPAGGGSGAQRGRLLALLVLVVFGIGSCTVLSRPDLTGSATGDAAGPAVPLPAPSPSPSPQPSPASPSSGWSPARPATPADGTTVVADDPTAAAATTLLAEAPVVLVVPAADGLALRTAAWLGLRLRAPVVAATGGADALADLAGVEVVVTVGDVPAGALPPAWRDADVRAVDLTGAPRPPALDAPPALSQAGPGGLLTSDVAPGRPDLAPVDDLLASAAVAAGAAADAPPSGVVLVHPDDPGALLAVVTARAGGWLVAPTAATDPRADDDLRATFVSAGLAPDAPTVLLGTTAGAPDPALLDARLATVRRGLELPGGGQLLLPGRRLVALYGTPGTGALGVLGEQDVAASIERVQALAAEYEEADAGGLPVVPTFEIITTIASSAAEPTGDYSRRVPIDVIRPWVDAAREAGVYVVLDLQPGRTDFVTQAQEYAELLREPHVGLALDPEWRLRPDQVHLRQIGQVGVEEVQATADWLAALVREEALPQKLFLLHQFQLRMLPDRERLVTPPELVTVVQMDGQGSQPAKLDTWRVLTTSPAPAGALFGWKNFHDEDVPTRSPADTVTLEPTPVFVSYQ
jgi:hypothetical protein